MSKTLKEIAQHLKDNRKKVQLIYAFNGSGKTRLSQEFKQLTSPKSLDTEGEEQIELTRNKILYYNAFTEDLFYWDNDLEADSEHKLKIQPNRFTDWILKDQGLDQRIIDSFQRFAGSKTEVLFDPNGNYVSFIHIHQTGNTNAEPVKGTIVGRAEHIKISKGEESNFIWSIFYTLLDQIITILNEPEEESTSQFNDLEYVFIDDPVSSLDENHLIELAFNLAELIKSAPPHLKFIITTHNPLFYNVLHNELNLKKQSKKEGCYLLEKLEDDTYNLNVKYGDSNKSFSYHLYLRQIIEKAIADTQIEKFHFMLLRNLYEKTASFLGYEKWQDLLNTVPGDKDAYLKLIQRMINFNSHRTLSSEEVRDPTVPEKQTVKLLLDNLINNYGYFLKNEKTND